MNDAACVAFLRWALPRLGLRWAGFRRVRRQVCKRLGRRLRALDLCDLAAYRRCLEEHPGEWATLDALCRVTISRFHRDRAVFEHLASTLLPALAAQTLATGETVLRAWSVGCASGEEPYTLAILWRLALAGRFPGLALAVLASDADAHLIERARRACYGAGSLRELPLAWREAAFVRQGRLFRLREAFRTGVAFRCEDVRERQPEGPFRLILCRNLAFTYFAEPLQAALARELAERLAPGGALVLGSHETLPADVPGLAPGPRASRTWYKTDGAPAGPA